MHIRCPEKFTLSIDESREQVENLYNIKPNQFVMLPEKMVFVIETLLTPIIKFASGKMCRLKIAGGLKNQP